MSDVDIESLLAPKASELKSISESAALALTGKGDGWKKVASGLTSLGMTLSGMPLAGALAPLGVEAAARAFGESTTALMRRELEALDQEEQRRQFLTQIDAIVATAIGQALIQMVRSQHQVKEEIKQQTIAALGGLRDDLEPFREDFQRRLGATSAAAVQIGRQLVEGGALGVRVRAATTKRVVIQAQHVRGPDSVGIDLE